MSVVTRSGTERSRTTVTCPSCARGMEMSWDMWGPYYVCQGCGLALDGDEELAELAAASAGRVFTAKAKAPARYRPGGRSHISGNERKGGRHAPER